MLAHLDSCAIRLCTICEKVKANFPATYRHRFYDGKKARKAGLSRQQVTTKIRCDLDQHIHFLLRDNVAHEENVKTEMAADRFDVLMKLTIREVFSALDLCANTIGSKEMNCGSDSASS